MWREFFDSFQFNLKNKTTNPFFGTLIMVWIFDHWEVIYRAFNFPYGTTLQAKIEYLGKYLNPGPFTKNLLLCIIVSVAVLITSYLLMCISRYLVNIYENRLLPVVYKISAPDKIVLKETFEREKLEKNRLEVRLEEEKESRVRLQLEIDKIEKENVELKEILANHPNNKMNISDDENPALYAHLVKKKQHYQFSQLIGNINSGRFINTDSNGSKSFAEMGLIKAENSDEQGRIRFTFTEKGKSFMDYFLKKFRDEEK